MSDERADAIALADKLLDEPMADPDDDLRTLSRQLLRSEERVARLRAALINARTALGLEDLNDDSKMRTVYMINDALEGPTANSGASPDGK